VSGSSRTLFVFNCASTRQRMKMYLKHQFRDTHGTLDLRSFLSLTLPSSVSSRL
jgi:hypothetical protein